MSVKLKSFFMILAVLIIGVAIGALVLAPTLARHRVRHLAEMRTREGFTSRLEHLIRPDDAQADTVRAILARHSEQFHEITDRHRAEMDALMDSLRGDLVTLLTEEQIDRIKMRGAPFRRQPRPSGRR